MNIKLSLFYFMCMCIPSLAASLKHVLTVSSNFNSSDYESHVLSADNNVYTKLILWHHLNRLFLFDFEIVKLSNIKFHFIVWFLVMELSIKLGTTFAWYATVIRLLEMSKIKLLLCIRYLLCIKIILILIYKRSKVMHLNLRKIVSQRTLSFIGLDEC
jgi:hypothetical protein